ncbi:MAG: type II toxin-antitoxin system mRNA interferase toxin, RelE/StbE family [Candidatus Omnitrophica bacterium]|nr:hypothetical protein [bacterium]NUN97966.1 type II toxin-antitoxin system mRNA interferase toxin, RelE/StbE family [Candidatus Omnitrophota bacterium]
MTHQLVWSAHFKRSAERFIRKHRDLAHKLDVVVSQLETDPTDPRLKLHPLLGGLSGFQAASLGHKFRIVLQIDDESKEITLVDIGSHDEAYGG